MSRDRGSRVCARDDETIWRPHRSPDATKWNPGKSFSVSFHPGLRSRSILVTLTSGLEQTGCLQAVAPLPVKCGHATRGFDGGQQCGKTQFRPIRIFVCQPVADFAPSQPVVHVEETQFFQPVETIPHGPVRERFGQPGECGRYQAFAQRILQLDEAKQQLVHQPDKVAVGFQRWQEKKGSVSLNIKHLGEFPCRHSRVGGNPPGPENGLGSLGRCRQTVDHASRAAVRPDRWDVRV